VQLPTPPTTIASKASQIAACKILRFLLHPSGNKNMPQTSGRTPHAPVLLNPAETSIPSVDTCAVTFPVTPEFSVSPGGLKAQAAFAGSPLHAYVNAPDEP
jgi:hypothetical protein